MYRCGKCSSRMQGDDIVFYPKWYHCPSCHAKLCISEKGIMCWSDIDGNSFTPLPPRVDNKLIDE